MTVLDIIASSDGKRSRQFFIRVENFPSSASHREVKAFFGGLTISPGGIFIKDSNVFVSFEQWRDMTAAMERDGKSIHGHKLLLSIVELEEVRQVCAKICQRHLRFVGVRKQEEVSPEGMRKIRPTTVRDKSFARDGTFAPQEVDTEECFYEKDVDCTTCKRLEGSEVPRRKIKPTSVRRIDDCSTAFMRTMMTSALVSSD